MRKSAIIVLLVGLMAVFSATACFAEGNYEQSSTTQNAIANENIAKESIVQVPIPDMKYYLERKTVAKWFETWDQQNQISYVYVFMHGNAIGYYVCNGKPVSTRSYLTPEEAYYANGATLQTPSLDGTYGEDNVGWRFFAVTESGAEIAVAVEGVGATVLYTNARIPIQVPNLAGD
jgi:hypothetical protein